MFWKDYDNQTINGIEELRAALRREGLVNQEQIMKTWDYFRQKIAEGDTSSAPRDWFESILDEMDAYIAEIESENKAALSELETYRNSNIDFAKRVFTAESERDRLKAELNEIKTSHAEVMAEQCDTGVLMMSDDRVHCTCVPVLRAEIQRLNAELADHRNAIEQINSNSVSIELYGAVVKELEELKTRFAPGTEAL